MFHDAVWRMLCLTSKARDEGPDNPLQSMMEAEGTKSRSSKGHGKLCFAMPSAVVPANFHYTSDQAQDIKDLKTEEKLWENGVYFLSNPQY